VANEVNARRINDEVNIFQGIHHSPIFLGVIVITLALQVRHHAPAAEAYDLLLRLVIVMLISVLHDTVTLISVKVGCLPAARDAPARAAGLLRPPTSCFVPRSCLPADWCLSSRDTHA
jgi:hypothetical protein